MSTEHIFTARRQRAIESIMDDERLTSDLTDDQARPLLEWATAHVARIAGDPSRPDTAIEQAITNIRRAIVRVASTAGTEHRAERLVQLAQQALETLEQ